MTAQKSGVLISRPEHEVVYQELCELVNKHAADLSGLELLAVAANMVGKIIALQDQRAVTLSQAMEVVTKNIRIGNAQVLAQLGRTEGNA